MFNIETLSRLEVAVEVSAKGSVPEGFIHCTQPSPVRSNRKIFRPAVLVWFAQTKPAKWSSTVRYCCGVCVVSVLLFVCLPWPRASPSHGTWLALLCFALTLPSYLNCLLNSTIPSCPPLRNRLCHFSIASASASIPRPRHFRFHGRGHVVRQRHAAGATTAAAAARVAVVGTSSARSKHLNIDFRWRSEFSKVSRRSILDMVLQVLNSFF